MKIQPYFVIISKYKEKKDLGSAKLPDAIRYLFYEDVLFQIGVPNNRPVIANAWSTANIDATLIV